MFSNRFERGLRAGNADTVLQPADNSGGEETPGVEIVAKESCEGLRVHADGNPKLLGGHKRECALESVGGDSDNGVWRGVQRDDLSGDVGISAEFIGPKRVAQHDDIVAARLPGLFPKEKP